MKRSLGIFSAVLAVCAAAPALAQNYVVTSNPQPYVPLSGATVVQLSPNSTTWDARDEGIAVIPLGFTFPYYGVNHTSVAVHSNGVITLGSSAQSTCTASVACSNVGNFPSTTSPTSVIAPWNADLDGTGGGDIRMLQPSPSEIVIEYYNWGYFSGSGRFNLQVRLNASGLFQVHYGTHTGTGTTGIGAGWKDHTGNQGGGLPACGAARTCSDSTFPTDTLFTVGQPVQADLYVDSVSIQSLTKTPNNDITLTVQPTFRNFGQTAASGFHWKAFLSTSQTSLTGAIEFYDSAVANQPVNVSGVSTNTAVGSGTALNVPPGNYYVLVQADTTNVVPEFSETNNVGATTLPFTQGFDLVAQGVSGAPATSGPGNSITVNVTWTNQGTDPSSGPVTFGLYLSADNLFDSNDFLAHTWTESSVSGGQGAVNVPQSFTVPMNVPGGDFHWILRANMGSSPVVEASTANNTAASGTKTLMQQADLELMSADLLNFAGTQPIREGFLGEKARLTATFRNIGGANANNFHIGVALSKDANLSLLPGGDFIFHDEPVAQVLAGAPNPTTATFEITLPLVDRAGNPVQPGSYYLFVILDSYKVLTQLNGGQDIKAVGTPLPEPINMRAPAADYAVIKVDVPAAAGVGEVMPLYRVIKNIGNLDGPKVQYRYYASANPLVTTSDVALPVLSSTGAVLDSGEVELEAGESDSRTDLVRVPAGIVPGTWYVGVVVDVGNVAQEHNKTNNAVAAASTVQIVPSTLVITTQQLPDATLGMPFDFKLSAQGAQENLTWSANGALPAGLTLTPAGTVGGVPTQTGVFAFTATVSNGNIEAMARLVVRVLAPTSELTITSASLPPVINSTTLLYRANLSAAGGTRPYAWKLLSGVLPNGLALLADGTVEGTPKPGVAIGQTPLLVEVSDALGNRVSRQLVVKVVESGALVITSLALSETMVNADYLYDVAARNADQSPLAKPLTWKISSGRLPEGMALTVAQDELGLLTGRALEAGDFVFSLQVTDARGRSDVADFILRVHPARAKISAVNAPGVLRPGDEVSYQYTTGNEQSRYRLFSGALPPGLTLDENGHVTGTVQMEEAALGTWNFVVEANAPATGSSLGAFALEVQPQPVAAGCNATGAGSGWLMLMAPVVALFGRRRGARALAALSAVALAVVPALAQAQTVTNYVVSGPFSRTYGALTGGTNVQNSLTASTGANNIALPFDFEFYGQTYKNIGISLNGYVAFDTLTGNSANLAIPHTSTGTTVPKVFIAPWWDSLNKTTTSPATIVRYGTVGTAPNRTFVVDWQNMCPTSTCSTQRVSFQLQLQEGTNKISFNYGPATGTWSGSASVGIQRATNAGQTGLSCGAACSTGNWPANQAIEFSLPPDLILRTVSVDDTGYVGVPFQAAATVGNNGGLKASLVRVRYWLSTDAILDTATDVLLGTSNTGDVEAGVDTVILGSLTIPNGTATGQYYLLSRVDPDNTVAETKENNNDGVPLLFKVGAPVPDLAVDAISAQPSMVGPGATLSVNRTVRNLGNAASGAFTVTYFVSDNSVVSISDTEIHKEQVSSIAASPGSSVQSVSMALPANLKAGQYWIGACADWDAAANPPSSVTEISEVNNCATGNSFVLNTGAVTVTTGTLPGGTQNAPYGQQLQATGGNGSYTWSLSSGALPAGMTLTAGGLISGTPSVAGAFSFTVKVSSGGEEATRSLSLTVADKNLPLAVADHQLPSAEFGHAYGVQLVAVGGVPPYLWTLKAPSRLPTGLNLSPDGFIEGRTTSTSDVPVAFTVEVEDREGTRAAKDLQILVTKPGSLQIATTRLPTAYLDEGYNASLAAVGGNGSYSWRVLKFQQLTQAPTDVPGPELTALPENFGIGIQGPSLSGTPRQAGLFAVTLRVSDPNGAEDITTLPLLVSYKRPLSITTTVLPDAFVGGQYQVRLSHNADASKVTVTWAEACVQQAASSANGVTYSCLAGEPTQRLPEGLVIGADGSISGVPVAPAVAAAEGSEGPVYSFLVRAVDDKGRADVRSLSIRVRPARATDGGGCSGTGLGPAALGLLALAGLWRRRRS